MSILNNIKKGVASSGSNKGKMIFVKADSKVRIRFLQEIEDGLEITMHDHFDRGVNSICQKHLKKKCALCKDDDMRTRQGYHWSVWDYDAKEVKIFQGFANNFNPLPSFVAMYENYGTIMDRDYIIQRDGSGTSSKYSVIPMDKVKFKNSKAKPYSKSKALEILDKAYPYTDVDDEDEDDVDTGVDVEDTDEDEDDDEENEYAEMTPKELYTECIERGLKAKKKQKAPYYIELLVDNDAEDEDDEDEEDEW